MTRRRLEQQHCADSANDAPRVARRGRAAFASPARRDGLKRSRAQRRSGVSGEPTHIAPGGP